jgi:hypothetical protein
LKFIDGRLIALDKQTKTHLDIRKIKNCKAKKSFWKTLKNHKIYYLKYEAIEQTWRRNRAFQMNCSVSHFEHS